jgi:hypothetical protein
MESSVGAIMRARIHAGYLVACGEWTHACAVNTHQRGFSLEADAPS